MILKNWSIFVALVEIDEFVVDVSKLQALLAVRSEAVSILTVLLLIPLCHEIV